MKRLFFIIAALAVISLACSIPVNIVPAQPTVPAAPPTVAEPPSPAPPTAIPVNASCGNLSLYLDPALASSYGCETIPESSGADMPAFMLNPQYQELTLKGYALADTFFPPHMDIFPIRRFRELAPDAINQAVGSLQGLLTGGTPASNNILPLLPPFNAGQVFFAQYSVLPFQNGRGIRYITMYAQAAYPVNNHEVFYSYQGMTDDGQYWISVIFPISSPILPASGDVPPNGQSWEDFNNTYETYITDITAQLNAQEMGSFTPTINLLDALINSIIVQP